MYSDVPRIVITTKLLRFSKAVALKNNVNKNEEFVRVGRIYFLDIKLILLLK